MHRTPYSMVKLFQYKERSLNARLHVKNVLTEGILPADQPGSAFIDDAIRIQKYYEELQGTSVIGGADISTSGSVVLRINGNREGNGHQHMILLYFATNWQDLKPSILPTTR